MPEGLKDLELGQDPLPHPAAGWIANIFGEEHARNFEELSLQIDRGGKCPPGEEGYLSCLQLDEIDGELEEFIQQIWGGGRYELRLKRNGRYVCVKSRKISGPLVTRTEAQRRLVPVADPADDDEDDGGGRPPPVYGPFANPFGDSGFLQAEAQRRGTDVPSLVRELRNWIPAPTPPQDSQTMNVVMQMMERMDRRDREARESERERDRQHQLELEKLRAEREKGNGQDANALAWKMMQDQQKSALEMIKANQTTQLEMMKTSAELQGKIVSSGMAGFMKIMAEMLSAAKDGNADDLISKLPDVIGRVMEPLGRMHAPGARQLGAPPPAGGPPVVRNPATAGAAGAPGTGGEAPDGAGTDAQVQGSRAAAVAGFLQGLVIGAEHQPDPALYWDERMEAQWGWLPAAVRKPAEQIDFSAPEGLAQFEQLLLEVPGVPPELLEETKRAIVGAGRDGLAWVSEFWEAAPWLTDDDEGAGETD